MRFPPGRSAVAAGLLVLWSLGLAAAEPPASRWVRVTQDQVGPRSSPALIWSPERKRFVLLGGIVSHEHRGDKPYHVQSFDEAGGRWENDLPPGAEKRGPLTGPVREPGFKTPYFEMSDRDGIVRPHPYQARMDYQYAYAPWDGKVYALVCGRTLRYDPVARAWQDLQPASGPAPATRSYKETLCWGALCADPVNREIVLFGGCGLATDGAGPGTWVYSTRTNTWRDLKLGMQPPPRALSPMAFDPESGRIVLFGGDGLDRLHADTWVYDTRTRSWEERRPALGPSPRFGHALLSLPRSKKVLLVGGKGYTSSTSYMARLYRELPFELWTYDVAGNAWSLLERAEKDAPPQPAAHAQVAAAGDQDQVLLVMPRAGSKPPSTWLGRVDVTRKDEAGTRKHGVGPGTVEYRTGPYDPAWYGQDVSPADPEAAAAVLAGLPANRWTALKCPKWPANRQGGGWSTVALDPDRDQILHLGGGHSSYFGNDVAHYDIRTGRWGISYRPQLALDYNYDLSGPGPWAFNNGPWGNHNYHSYAYDPTCKRLVYLRAVTQMYDPEKRAWPFAEKVDAPFPISKYTTYLCPTPGGVVAWTRMSESGPSPMGLFRLEQGRKWVGLPVRGDALPVSVTDGSTIVFDPKRNRLILTTTPGKPGQPAGQVWTVDLKTGEVRQKNPAGMEAIRVPRFAREAVYLPRQDLVMVGYHLGPGNVTPFYDVAANRWLRAKVAGAEFYAPRQADGIGASVDLGLVYDARRDLVWGVMCRLQGTGALNVLRVDAAGLDLRPLE